MKSSLETRLGMFFAVVTIAGFILFEMLGGANVFNRGTIYRARFSSARDLKVGDPVKLSGVPVGRVKSVAVVGNRVEVGLQVDPKAPVRTDSVAAIQFTGLMGQNFVALTFGGENSPLAVADTLLQSREQADLSDLMTRLDNVASGVEGLTKSFSGEEISKLFGPLTDFMKQNQSNITTIVSNMRDVTSEMAQGRGSIGRLLKDPALFTAAVGTMNHLNDAVSDVKPLTQEARGMMTDLRSVVGKIEKGEGTIGKFLSDPSLFNQANGAVGNLREILEKINRGTGSIGELVNDNAFLKNVKLTLQKVDKATETLEDTGPISVIGTAVGVLF